ncbi:MULTISPECIES: hypothetical protein [unclassified Bradyrhizobium]|uniref:hypothetical protein n=1 Tax=unclassified Bradyrhizobium TaxID=2631580 RepID=UPI0024798A4F|nr:MULTISPECIES: hypothetical protein [unclassified Bradyrhizobium]WGR97579.1 hypothetical protein MTX23_24660 [Bradyrhizobium sp. ISRA436]WGS04469.1 hypothetical protein MTX18_24665 [Bradyrhizobium sp. ISRA437]WGS11350.1 hypothetical protein MTX26_24665 [Bradyrhizobium sp. ISRA443]WGS18691.1 hypothetical protein MTX22_29695 [Bradyrhizobium sp. ISRA463]WGS25516.1 hypothetical protein MTX19_27280 [Bradyrhizobium sp. ISRA464]
MLCAFTILGFSGLYVVGDLSRYQEAISKSEGHVAMRGVSNPEQLDQALKQHPSNVILKMIALASLDATEMDAAARRLLTGAEQKDLPKAIDLASSRSDLDALLRDLKAAEGSIATFEPRYIALVNSKRDKLEGEARSLRVGNDTIRRFMSMVDAQHTEIIAVAAKLAAAHAEYYKAYDKCVTLLLREFGIYKVKDGQFVFPFQLTADNYNRAAAAMMAATKRIAELDDEMTALGPSQLNRWKAFVEQ